MLTETGDACSLFKGHYALCFKTRASFGAHCENLNEDGSILSATKMYPNDSSFCQYKVSADIRGGSLERWRQTTVG